MASTKSKKSRKGLAVGLAVLGVAGLSLASAATLTVNSSTLGSGVQVVASCDTDGIDVSYETTFVPGTTPIYKVNKVVLKNVNATCQGKTVQIDLYDGAATPARIGGVASTTLTLTGTPTVNTATLTLDASPVVNAAAVVGVGVIIQG